MENASTALIMAATILIGVLIMSTGVYLFNHFGERTKDINERMEQAQIDQINVQFTKYEGVTTCSAHDIVSIANLAKQYNTENGFTTPVTDNGAYYIQVSIKMNLRDTEIPLNSLKNFESLPEEKYQTFMSKYSLTTDNKKQFFTCTDVTVNNKTGRVSKISFEQN